MIGMSTEQTRHNKQLGAWGETYAADYLTQHGYVVLQSNWRAGRAGEIDIIVEKPPTLETEAVLVFVEVKTRRHNHQGHPLEAIDARKQAQMLSVAEAFLAQHPEYTNTHCVRFDGIGIECPTGQTHPIVHHIEHIMG